MNPSISSIIAAVEIMEGFSAPRFVSGGWAIDLFLGRVTREHADIEIGIYRRDQSALWDQLPGWSFAKVIQEPAGGKWVAWEKGEELRPPVHQLKAGRSGSKPGEIEFFLNERNDTHWISRRHPGLERPVGEVTLISREGVPILSPEIQLLYKAKETRPKDQADFELTVGRLTRIQANWLADALRRYHPDHAWVKAING